MQHYDLLYFVSSTLEDTEVQGLNDEIKKQIESFGGKITKDVFVGRRKLAYKIKQHKYGIYTNLYFDLDTKELSKLENFLRLEAHIVRYLVIKAEVKEDEPLLRLTEQVEAPKEEKKEKVEKETPKKEEVEVVEEVKEEKEEPKEESIEETVEEKKEKVSEKKKPQKKVSLEELDEKLDKILSDDIIK